MLFNAVDRYWRGYKPLFRIDGDTLKLTNVPVPPPHPAAQQPTSQAPSAERWLYRSSYIYRSVSDAVNPNETSVPDYVRFADLEEGNWGGEACRMDHNESACLEAQGRSTSHGQQTSCHDCTR